MRVTSDFFVSALLRRLQGEGGFATIIRRGATEAGAIFLIVRGRSGELKLFGPAPQVDYDMSRPTERYFALLIETADDSELDARLEREKRFDPDIWVVELEASEEAVSRLIEIRTP